MKRKSSLSLVLCDMATSSPSATSLFPIVQQIYVLLSGFCVYTQRWTIGLFKTTREKITVKSHWKTRWETKVKVAIASCQCIRSCTVFQSDVCGFQDSHPCLPVTARHGSSIAVDCQLVSNEGHCHSNYGDRCFAAAGPKLWNSLPADLRQADINF